LEVPIRKRGEKMEKNSQEKKVRLGIVGCGSISYGHINRFLNIPKVDLVALVDVNQDKIKRVQEKIFSLRKQKILVFNDYEKMLSKVNLDAVAIFTPHTLHFSQVMESLKKGLHVLVEKPMVTEILEAEEIIKEAKIKKRIVLVSYQLRYEPVYKYARKIMKEKKIGEIQFISALITQDWREGLKRTNRLWRLDPELSGGGMLMDSGSHLLDILLWLSNLTPEKVYSFSENKGEKVDINSAISIRFSNGALGNISVIGDDHHHWELSIWGSRGNLFLRDNKVYVQNEEGTILKPQSLPLDSDPDTNFIRAILEDKEVLSPPEDALKVTILTQAIYQSASSGKEVKVKKDEV